MLITNTITMAIDRQQNPPVIDAVQGDANSRAIKIKLTSGGQPWTIPPGAACLVRFGKPDKTGGVYDTLEDGTSAIEWGDGYLQLILASQVLSCPGMVMLQAEISYNSSSIATFVIMICVQEDPSVGTTSSEDYYNLSKYVKSEVEKLIGSGIPGGTVSNDFIVNFYPDASNGGCTADKSFDDIAAAIYNKMKVCGVFRGSISDIWLPDVFAQIDHMYISFGGQYVRAEADPPEVHQMLVVLYTNNSVLQFSDVLLMAGS